MSSNLVSFDSFQSKNIHIPSPALQNIFSFLSIGELSQAMSVCKEWQQNGNAVFTKKCAVLDEFGYDFSGFTHKKLHDWLSKNRRHKAEFDLFITNREKMEDGSDTQQICEQMEITHKGVNAICRLYKINQLSDEQLKTYALQCKDWSHNCLLKVTKAFVSKRKFDLAKEILTYCTYDPFKQVDEIIKIECQEHRLEAAVKTFQQFSLIMRTQDKESVCHFLLRQAYLENREEIIEDIIATFQERKVKFQKIVELIRHQLEKADYARGIQLLTKYQKELNIALFMDSDLHTETREVLRLYVRLNQLEKADKFAIDHYNSDPQMLQLLKGIYIQMKMTAKADEIQKLIDKIKKDSGN